MKFSLYILHFLAITENVEVKSLLARLKFTYSNIGRKYNLYNLLKLLQKLLLEIKDIPSIYLFCPLYLSIYIYQFISIFLSVHQFIRRSINLYICLLFIFMNIFPFHWIAFLSIQLMKISFIYNGLVSVIFNGIRKLETIL